MIGPLVAKRPGIRVTAHPDPFEALLGIVVGQQISLAGARTMTGRLVAHYGHPGPGWLRAFFRSALFFPAIPSMAVLGLVWSYILSPIASGALNTVLDTLFGAGPVPWLSDDNLARMSVILVGVWGAAGWHAVLHRDTPSSIAAMEAIIKAAG